MNVSFKFENLNKLGHSSNNLTFNSTFIISTFDLEEPYKDTKKFTHRVNKTERSLLTYKYKTQEEKSHGNTVAATKMPNHFLALLVTANY